MPWSLVPGEPLYFHSLRRIVTQTGFRRRPKGIHGPYGSCFPLCFVRVASCKVFLLVNSKLRIIDLNLRKIMVISLLLKCRRHFPLRYNCRLYFGLIKESLSNKTPEKMKTISKNFHLLKIYHVIYFYNIFIVFVHKREQCSWTVECQKKVRFTAKSLLIIVSTSSVAFLDVGPESSTIPLGCEQRAFPFAKNR